MSNEATFEAIEENGELVALHMTAPDGRELLLRRGSVDLATFEAHAKTVMDVWHAPFVDPVGFTGTHCPDRFSLDVLHRIRSPFWFRHFEEIKAWDAKESKEP